MTVEDLTRIGIQEEKLSSNLYPFWNTTPMLSHELAILLWL